MNTDLKAIRQYMITSQFPNGETIRRDVEGYRVVIPGFEDFGFFVHRATDPIIEEESTWRVSEVETGFGFPLELEGYTRQEAIRRTTRFLHAKGKSKFLEAMGKARNLLREKGVSV